MHEIAERGVAAHWYYKENGSQAPLDKELESWINWVREMFDQKQGDGNVSPKELIESFKLNLYQDEIYVFTPKGDLKILPKGATAIDFAFYCTTLARSMSARGHFSIAAQFHQLASSARAIIVCVSSAPMGER